MQEERGAQQTRTKGLVRSRNLSPGVGVEETKKDEEKDPKIKSGGWQAGRGGGANKEKKRKRWRE